VASLRHIHAYMNERRSIALTDGRTGKVVRVDTEFPANETTVTVWTETSEGPRTARVRLEDVVGAVPR